MFVLFFENIWQPHNKICNIWPQWVIMTALFLCIC